MKILLLGKNGKVRWELQRSLSVLGELIALDRQSEPYGDLGEPERLADKVQTLRPDVIVNAAANTAVDKAKKEIDLTRTINATVPMRLGQIAAETGAWLAHYSTDYVFDGSGTRTWQEEDSTGPLGVCGQTKLEGEHTITASGCNHLIYRTSWVHAARGGNIAKTKLRMAQKRPHLTMINNQIGASTGTDLIAEVTARAIRAALQKPELSGFYHLAASGATSWHDYADYVITRARQWHPKLNWKVGEIASVPTCAFPTPAKRPLNRG